MRRFVAILASALLTCGCGQSAREEVVVYTALDREFSEPILEQFESETGIRVLPKYDAESTKTVGLVNVIIQEQNRPRCDLFWNNEMMHMLRLKESGLLDVYAAPAAGDYPASFRSPDNDWYGFAARIRVLVVNTDLVPEDKRPTSVMNLVDPEWQDQVGIAKPLFGTTATHGAVLFAEWGQPKAEEFFGQLKRNAQILSGNKQVAQAVAVGQLAFGLTDTDDAIIERDKGMPVEIVYPDQGDQQMGALFIPNTLGLIRGGPHPAAARRLMDYLLSGQVEAQLAQGDSAQFPLSQNVDTLSRAVAADSPPIKHMDVDFAAAAEIWPQASEFLKATFETD